MYKFMTRFYNLCTMPLVLKWNLKGNILLVENDFKVGELQKKKKK